MTVRSAHFCVQPPFPEATEAVGFLTILLRQWGAPHTLVCTLAVTQHVESSAFFGQPQFIQFQSLSRASGAQRPQPLTCTGR